MPALRPATPLVVTSARSSMLFDGEPGAYQASDFARRSDWPSTTAFYTPGEAISYSETFNDYQGRNFNDANWTYRRVQSRRVGIGYR